MSFENFMLLPNYAAFAIDIGGGFKMRKKKYILDFLPAHFFSQSLMKNGYIDNITLDQMGWPNELSIRLPFWYIMGFKPWSCETNDLKIDTCHFLLILVRCSPLLG